ncbi:exodeoxyribonuclease III [Pelagibius litoralis]|uniref:Exodeoxyribonuclease III n=1 Tax=Pelagibius litoralis TaxID=374515 RepID=A0A967F0U3_9PROT|nr:exodeoxyribonuclease III [Pelagibius litoralis]NIA71000.1 exodeoxyribonuclease III [Pelagibius litoralis]
MPLRIATWNVNSLRQRIDHLARFAKDHEPDVICLQEIKMTTESFPAEALAEIGYPHAQVHGQKGYNGVAIISRRRFTKPDRRVWCGRDDCRHVAVNVGGVELHNFYVPAGGDIPDPERNDKFAHKLQFLTEMAKWARKDKLAERKAVLVGDLNVAPLENDVWNHKRLRRNVGHTPVEAEHMAKLWAAGGLIDAPRHFIPEPEQLFTWWGYRFPQAFAKNYGWRLDHVLVTEALRKSMKKLTIARETRTWEKPSDHVPVVLDLK